MTLLARRRRRRLRVMLLKALVTETVTDIHGTVHGVFPDELPPLPLPGKPEGPMAVHTDNNDSVVRLDRRNLLFS